MQYEQAIGMQLRSKPTRTIQPRKLQDPQKGAPTHLSHPNNAATPTKAARSSDRISLPFPGAVKLRNVERICEAIGIAGCRAEGNNGVSSAADIVAAIASLNEVKR